MAGVFGLSDKEKRIRDTASARADSEIIFKERPDRVGPFLKKHLDKFIFDEFSVSYLKKAGGSLDFMKGIPIPLRKEDIKDFNSKDGLSVLVIAENMAWIIGIDPKFKYVDAYLTFMNIHFGKKVDQYLVKEAKDAAEKNDFDDACIHFRASLCVKPDYLDSMYGYARVCRKMYEAGNNETYIGKLKAEAFDYFELITEIHPRFAQGFYYLGYMYLNMGLYAKAKAAWDTFLTKSLNGKDKKEIKSRLKQIALPLEIEKGYNEVLAQRWDNGIAILEPFLAGEYKEWWPLSYYLGVAYSSTGRQDEAIERLKTVMKLNPGHIETMLELADIYEALGQKEKVKKYKDKAALIQKGGYKSEDEATLEDDDTNIISDKKLETRKKEVKKLKKLEKKV